MPHVRNNRASILTDSHYEIRKISHQSGSIIDENEFTLARSGDSQQTNHNGTRASSILLENNVIEEITELKPSYKVQKYDDQVAINRNHFKEPKILRKADTAKIRFRRRSNSVSSSERRRSPIKNTILRTLSFTRHLLTKTFSSNMHNRLQCACESNLRNHETCIRAKKWFESRHKEQDKEYLRNIYNNLDKIHFDDEEKILKKIRTDLKRTLPKVKFFSDKQNGQAMMERLLVNFTKYDREVGYVQGMNYVAASLLYHCEEYIAFWLLVMLFEKRSLRELYKPGSTDCRQHCKNIDYNILTLQPEIYKRFSEQGIHTEVFVFSWMLSLFGTVVPINDLGYFFDGFIKEGWPFFYRLVLAILGHYKKDILSNSMEQNLKLLNETIIKKEDSINWRKLIKSCPEIKITREVTPTEAKSIS